MCRTQAGAGRNIRNQTGLVAKLSLGRSGYDLHALDGADWKLGGEDLALLIGDGLPVNHEAHLRVIA